jgi:hypothetical protein
MPFTNLYEHNHLEASSPSTSGGDDAAEPLSWSMISMELSPSEIRSVMKMWSNRTFQEETGKETPRSASKSLVNSAKECSTPEIA